MTTKQTTSKQKILNSIPIDNAGTKHKSRFSKIIRVRNKTKTYAPFVEQDEHAKNNSVIPTKQNKTKQRFTTKREIEKQNKTETETTKHSRNMSNLCICHKPSFHRHIATKHCSRKSKTQSFRCGENTTFRISHEMLLIVLFVSIAYAQLCGNGKVDTGEDCDGNESFYVCMKK